MTLDKDAMVKFINGVILLQNLADKHQIKDILCTNCEAIWTLDKQLIDGDGSTIVEGEVIFLL